VRVLVVDDCRLLADVVAEGLSDQGMAADVAYDGAQAADKLCVNNYDVVVLDRALPGVPGDALCEMISSDERCPMVLMLSGAASPGYLSVEQLLETVWDDNADPFTKTVTVTIGRLRRRLGEPQVIETAIGVGYRVVN
jgi:DNA-binding response OmpR family regulator